MHTDFRRAIKNKKAREYKLNKEHDRRAKQKGIFADTFFRQEKIVVTAKRTTKACWRISRPPK